MKLRLKYRDQELTEREFNIAFLSFCIGVAAGGILTVIGLVI